MSAAPQGSSKGVTKESENIASGAEIYATIFSPLDVATSSSIDVRRYSYMTVTLKARMDASATADPVAVVNILTSYDNTNFDDSGYEYVTALTLALSAGNTKQKTSNLIDLRGINYIKNRSG